jgi:hypothetical protein
MVARMPAGLSDHRKKLALKIGAFAGIFLYLLLIAKSVAGASGAEGFHLPLVALILACAPLAIFAAVRMPMIFPFGLFVALIPFDPLLSVSRGATLVHALGILTAVALLARILVTRNVLRLRTPWYYWLAYVVWAGLTMMWTVDLKESRLVFGIIFQNFGMMTVLAAYPMTRRDFKIIIGIMICAGVVAISYALATNGGLGGGTARISIASSNGNVVDQNFFATSFMLPIAFAFAAATSTRRTLLRAAYLIAVGAMMLGVLVSGSRGAFLALGLMFAYFAFRSRSLAQVGLLFAAFVAMLLRYPLVWERFMHDDGGGTGSGRTLIWQVGLQALRGHWLVGTGVGSFPESYARVYLSAYQHSSQGWMRPAHNVLVGMSVELGIIGLGLLLTAWFKTFRSLRVIPRSSPNFAFRTACEAAILALAVQSLFIDPMWLKYIWLGFTLPFMVLNLERPQAAFARRAVRRQFVPAPGG